MEGLAAEEGDDEHGMEGLAAEEGLDAEEGDDVHGKLGVKGEGKTETANKGYIYDKEAEKGEEGEGGYMPVQGTMGGKGKGKKETVNRGYIYDKGTKGKGGKVLSGPITEQHEGMPNPRILKNKHGFNGHKLDR